MEGLPYGILNELHHQPRKILLWKKGKTSCLQWSPLIPSRVFTAHSKPWLFQRQPFWKAMLSGFHECHAQSASFLKHQYKTAVSEWRLLVCVFFFFLAMHFWKGVSKKGLVCKWLYMWIRQLHIPSHTNSPH